MPARGTPSGMTPNERAVMELWDKDLGADAIAEKLGIPRQRAMNVIAMYHANDGHFDRNVVAGSQALLAALRREAFA